MSDVLNALLSTLPDGKASQVIIGMHWTAFVAEVEGRVRCGLASTLSSGHKHHGEEDVPQAGRLEAQPGLALAQLVKSDHLTMASVGMAAINALLPTDPATWTDLNAEAVIARQGTDKEVALIGHFPFVPRLRTRVGRLHILEQSPRPGDLPARAAANILPQVDVVAITGTTLINHTMGELLQYCSPRAVVILLGPSTPLSPVLFDHGVDFICGAHVTAIGPVLRTVRQGGNFRQVRRAGVRTVVMDRQSC